MNLIFRTKDGTEIIFDEYTHDEEYHSYWVTMCEKCLGKYRKHLGHRVDDHGSGCCSVCGCDTPSWNDWGNERCEEGNGSCYVDFDENEVSFVM